MTILNISKFHQHFVIQSVIGRVKLKVSRIKRIKLKVKNLIVRRVKNILDKRSQNILMMNFSFILFIDLTTRIFPIAISNMSLGGLELPPEVIMSIIVCDR